ncbi:hypothetical protein C8035_v009643 [Colletotrichum spinosum]|uniref:Uncharacterized protein n=1 Tax=Colletotrichum spinosum TaxID=1347390 RepID=A0A4R8QJG3_9PEZI|nr:hypothetical protein C8035_v009643 [Colletotrichum spinosum]
MFGGSRRNRRASQPLTAATANPAAATAAVSAFARRASSSSLVTAAAAANAALKARPITPINVAEVETKRTRRRSVSASSHGSQDARKGLQRSHSQGSMTERTFRSRSPSPHRTPVPPAEDAPPVPTIPDNVRTKAGHTTRGRPTSLQLQPFRVASQKQNDGTGSWFGAATEGDLTNVRTSDAPVHDIQPESRNGASSEASGPSRYGSEVTAVEAPVPRKKSVRVSFDEENTKILGLSAEKSEHDSPVPLSPQTARRHWYTHLGRNRKQDIISFDDDELMKPRPALPSFGSVRDKKPREIEERPLVRPIEPPATDAPAHEPSSELGDEPPSPSSDYNTNFGLESMAKNPANISRFREPLPPVVTSVEGSGYFSASITSSEDEDEPEIVQEPEPALPPAQVREEIIAAHPGMADDAAVGVVAAPQVDHRSPQPHEEALPLISIIQPTPTPKEIKTTYEPLVEETESEGDSVYSDAYEDLAEMEGDGFMSLDAVITAPVPDKVSQQLYEEVLNAPQESRQSPDTSETSSTVDTFSTADFPIDDEWRHAKLYWRSLNIEKRKSLEREAKAVEKAEGELGKTDARQVSSTPDFTPAPSAAATDDKWRHAKMYWRSLTIEKRKQLEREAAKEEAGTEGDLEEVARRKKTKRKKLARRNGLGQHSSPESETVHQTKPEPEVVTKEESPHRIKRKSLPERRPSEPSGTVKLQKTMRATTTPQPAASGMGMRKTLRSDPSAGPTETNHAQFGGSWGMRQSLRQNGNSQGVMPRERPLSFQGPPPRHEDEDRRSKRASLDASLMNSTEMAKLMHANLRRRGSDSSETSFRRSRPPRESFGFRTSMRNAPPQPLMAESTSRFSLQPGSPPGSPSSPPPVSMSNRMTMRAMRSDSSVGSSRRVRLFGKSSGKKPTKPRLKSRFEDSSDEDEAGPSRFASRFDSSDDERAPTATPAVRPVPRTMRTSSSAAAVAMKMPTPQYDEKAVQFPDVQDESSSEEEFPSRRKKPLSARQFSGVSGRLVKTRTDSQGLRRSGSGRGALLESSTAPSMGTQVMSRPSSHRRGSLLSVLRRKKDSDPGKISRAPPSESAARMDTRLERSPEEISGLRLNPPHALDHSMDNWPLIETVDFEKRPRTADPNQHVDSSRPVFAQRRSTNQLLTAGRHGDDETVDGSVKKKKKFKALRRMFKLDD